MSEAWSLGNLNLSVEQSAPPRPHGFKDPLVPASGKECFLEPHYLLLPKADPQRKPEASAEPGLLTPLRPRSRSLLQQLELTLLAGDSLAKEARSPRCVCSLGDRSPEQWGPEGKRKGD